MNHWTEKVYKFQPCTGGMAWARKFPTAQAAWDACERPEWMCWLLGKTGSDKRDMTLLACQFARLALPHARGDAAELAICTAEQWAHGDEEVTREDSRDASAWADAAAAAADAWDAAAAAAAEARDAVGDHAADARSDTLRRCCTIIRRFYPEVPL